MELLVRNPSWPGQCHVASVTEGEGPQALQVVLELFVLVFQHRRAGGTQECGVRAGGGAAGERSGGAGGRPGGGCVGGAGPRGLARAAVAWRHRRGRSTAPPLRRSAAARCERESIAPPLADEGQLSSLVVPLYRTTTTTKFYT